MEFNAVVVFSLLSIFLLLGCTQGPLGQANQGFSQLVAPENLIASSTQGKVVLKWNPTLEADFATIYRETQGIQRTAIGNVQFSGNESAQDFSFTDSQIARGTVYTYCVTQTVNNIESTCSNDITITAR
ncbi:MAG: hypothetical protein Q7S21_01105 [archaeon]|nr:hypothetical protein [archaeon]